MLAITVGTATSQTDTFRKSQPPRAPMKVASDPNRMSAHTQPVVRLARKQPMVMPGMAAGVKNERMQSASEMRT